MLRKLIRELLVDGLGVEVAIVMGVKELQDLR